MFKKKQYVEIKELPKLIKNPPSNSFVPIYGKIKNEQVKTMNKGKKYTLNEIGNMVSSLSIRVDKIDTRLNRVENRIDRIEAHLDQIDARLDYNNLKDLPTGNK